MILWMYTQPNSTTLTIPLGQWLAPYSQDYKWAWRIEPTQTLYLHHHHVWHEYWTPCQCLNTWIYSNHWVPRASIPVDMTLVTPNLNNNSIAIALPIVQILAADPSNPLPEHTLYGSQQHQQPGINRYGTKYDDMNLLLHYVVLYKRASK